jgi:hypothetical protein
MSARTPVWTLNPKPEPMDYSMRVKTTRCRMHPRCASDIHISISSAIFLLSRARMCGFNVSSHICNELIFCEPYERYAYLDLIPILARHIQKHGPVRVAWLSREPHGWLVHSTRVSIEDTRPLPKVFLTPDTSAPVPEQPLPFKEAIHLLKALKRSGAIRLRPFGEHAPAVPLRLSNWDVARLLWKLRHRNKVVVAMRYYIRWNVGLRGRFLREVSRLVFAILANPDSQPAKKLDMMFSDLSNGYNAWAAREALDVLHTVTALHLGQSCQEVQTLLKIQREVFQSSGSAVRSLVVSASPHLAVATALDLTNRP